MRRETTTIEKLRYRFTPEEHLQNAQFLAEKLDQVSEMKADHDDVKADLKEQEKKVEAEIGRFTRLVRDQFEMRDVQCRWDFGRPSNNQKTLIRLDTNDDVRVEILLDHERQEMLKLEMPSHILSGPGSLKDQKVNTLADSDIDYFASRDEDALLKFGWVKADIDAIFEEAKRRAVEKAKEIKPASTAEVAAASETVNDSAAQFVAEAVSAEAPPTDAFDASADECPACDAGVPLKLDGLQHQNGAHCPVGYRNAEVPLPPQEEPVEAAHTLPSVRAIDGPKQTRRRSAGIKPPTAAERAQIEQIQAEEAAEFEQAGYPQDGSE